MLRRKCQKGISVLQARNLEQKPKKVVRLELIIKCEGQTVRSHSYKLAQSSPKASKPSRPGLEASLPAGRHLPLLSGVPCEAWGTLTDVNPGERTSLIEGDDGGSLWEKRKADTVRRCSCWPKPAGKILTFRFRGPVEAERPVRLSIKTGGSLIFIPTYCHGSLLAAMTTGWEFCCDNLQTSTFDSILWTF